MPQEIEIPLEVQTDADGEECYVGNPTLSAKIDLAKTTFVVLHPEEDSGKATMFIRQRRGGGKRYKDAVPKDLPALKEAFLDELGRAEDHFTTKVPDGYVGYGYFITHWKSKQLPFGVNARKPIIDQLVEDKKVEVYTAPDGKEAIRLLD